VVNGLALTGGDDEPATGAEIDRPLRVEDAGGVPGGHEGEVEILVMERATGIAGIDLLHPEARHMHGKLIDGDEWRRGLLADRDGVAGVILMAVGQRHMGHAFRNVQHCVARTLEGRIPGKERVNQDA